MADMGADHYKKIFQELNEFWLGIEVDKMRFLRFSSRHVKAGHMDDIQDEITKRFIEIFNYQGDKDTDTSNEFSDLCKALWVMVTGGDLQHFSGYACEQIAGWVSSTVEMIVVHDRGMRVVKIMNGPGTVEENRVASSSYLNSVCIGSNPQRSTRKEIADKFTGGE